MAATIGLKIANGEFYSLLEENSAVKKRLILTTVHDGQKSVQIDLYKSFTKSMADALYIGSLVVENIKPKSKGEPSVEMIIASNKEGEIAADAVDLDTSVNAEHHHLSVSLKSLDEDNRDYEIPDFELETNEPPPTGLYEKASAVKKNGNKKGFPWIIIIIIGVIIIAACLLAWLFLFNNKEKGRYSPAAAPPAEINEPVPVIEAPPPSRTEAAKPAETAPAASPPVQKVEPAKPVEAVPAASPAGPAAPTPPPAAPSASRKRSAAPVASYKAPATIPPEGVTYKIRWGDTLWDISEAFYRNPRLYTRLARVNNIRDPDLIISGNNLRIPPK
ncbi:MAG: LysM peptidoglycan-binding domain-containing protein [Treponema sp.]|jgi:nucleoid-associated protein YgaU|nr:LysM peptidoglycan-binding domain-containing protein [Treponema sp.]